MLRFFLVTSKFNPQSKHKFHIQIPGFRRDVFQICVALGLLTLEDRADTFSRKFGK
jgi:hypothetical protein